MSASLVAPRPRSLSEQGSKGERLPPLYPELAGKRVLITGASRGIGSAVARAFAREGCNLVLQFNEGRDAMLAVADDIREDARGLRVFPCNFSDEPALQRLSDAALRAFGGLDIVINNATASLADLPLEPTADDLEDAVAASLRAPYLLSRQAADAMRHNRSGGAIINVTAVPAEASAARLALYGMTKSALERMSRSLAQVHVNNGVRFNTLSPGLALAATGVAVSGLAERDAEVLAEAALHLASGQAACLNGLSLSVDDVEAAREEQLFG